MTDEEKEQHPEYKTTRGYLKVLDESECGQLWWNNLETKDKDIIKAIPNFDQIFFTNVLESESTNEKQRLTNWLVSPFRFQSICVQVLNTIFRITNKFSTQKGGNEK